MPSWKKVIISGSDASLNSLNISTALTASGLIYPTVDGTVGQVITTDGVGNLSFLNVDNTRISIKNVSGGEITKGTPLFITGSGTNGNIAGVVPADAGNPSLMPAGVIAGETLADGAEGVGLINGFISGVNTSLFAPGDEVFVAVGGGYTNVVPTGSSNLIQKLGNVEKSSELNGSGVINGPGAARSVPNIQQGYTWVGDANGVAQPTTTSSLVVNNAISASYALTASYVVLEEGAFSGSFSGSFYGDGSNLTGISVSEISTVTSSFTDIISTTVTHNLDSKNLLVSIYDTNDSQIIPEAVTLTDNNNISIDFAITSSGYVVIAKGGHIISGSAINSENLNNQPGSYYLDYNNHTNIPSGIISGSSQITTLTTYKESISGSSSYNITHNLDEEFPIVQTYQSSSKSQVIPQNVISLDSNSIQIDFVSNFEGYVIIKK